MRGNFSADFLSPHPSPLPKGGGRKKVRYWAVAICFLSLVSNVLAAPTGGNVVGGSGTISTPTANTTVIEQQSQALAIDWQSFNVEANESVQFIQPNQNAAALNRILDQNPSRIFGSISANGKVFLINPNGMVFGVGSQVNVGALVASTLNIGTDDFLSGRYDFFANDESSYATILNQGTLTAAEGGSINLVADGVRNEGLIIANLGQINLASGRQTVLSFDGNRLLNFSVSGEGINNAVIENSGSLIADGGSVVLSAKAANDVLANVINNEGVIRANRIDDSGGVVQLLGSGGITITSGLIDASGSGEGATGGTVEITGDRVGVAGAAEINVNGPAGGGNISIGQTSSPDASSSETRATHSQFTQLGAGTRLSADALDSGDGGNVTVWAEDTVWANGHISAQGGDAAGNGGFVDISGIAGIAFNGAVDLRAPNGTLGTLLFDPTDIVIHDQADGPQANDGLLPDLSDLTVGAGNFAISETALEALAGNATVILEASNDITVNNLADNQLSLATTSSGSITLRADNDNNGTGAFTMNTGDTISTQGGAITISGGLITTGAISTDIAGTNDGAISITSTGSATVGSLNAGAQSITVTVDSNNNGVDSLTLNGTLSGTGGITLSGGTDGSETLNGPNSNNTWTITSLGAGTLNGAVFSRFTNLTGGSADDSFVISGIGNITGLIDGGAHTSGDSVNYSASSGIVSIALGVDVVNIETLVGGGADFSLAAGNVPNTWVITGQDDGTVAGLSFTDFSNLTGGSNTDTFTLNGGSVTGTVTGGAGTDTLTANNVANGWNILSANGGNVDNVFAFTGIENITGGSGNDTFILNNGTISGTIDGGAGTDSLAPDNVANTWTISGANAGSVTGVGAFSGIEDLNGRNFADTFTFAVGSSISGTVDGGGGSDSVSLAALAGSVVVDLAGSGYANIERYTGNNTDSTLIGDDIANSWSINGTFGGLNDGLLNATITFENFNNLTGGAGVDTFALSGGTIDGLISGGSANDTLIADNAANTWTISADDAGTLNSLSFTGIESLTGNIGVDIFQFSNGSSISGAVNGAAGNDIVNFSGEAGAVSVDIGNSGFSNIESYVGNNTNSTLIGANSQNTWTLSGQNDGLLGTIQFTDFNNLTGNANIDTFTLSGGSLTGTLDGGTGSDTLVAGNQANTWNITGANTGTVTGVSIFSNVENLTGNAAADAFVIANGASISGVMNGAGGSDSVDYSSIVGMVSASLDASNVVSIETIIGNGSNSTLTGSDITTTWTITGADSGIVNSVNFIDFSNLVGNSSTDTFVMSGGSITGSIDGGGGSDTILGADTDTTWNISGVDTGDLTSVTDFASIELLRGGSGIDTFVFANGGSYSGTINGSTGNDILDMSALSGAVTIDLSAGDIQSIESLIGNGTNSTLISDNASHVWVISGGDSGLMDSIAFSGFNNLTGGSLSDFFTISGGSLSGTLNGGSGTDTLTAGNSNNTWSITGTNGGSVTGIAGFSGIENLTGNILIDNFVFENLGTISGTVNGSGGQDSVDLSAKAGAVAISLDNTGYSNIETFIGNNAGSTLTGANNSNTWTISGINDGTVGTVTFFNFNNLQGNSSSDSFVFNDGSSITGSVDGGPGLDTVNFSAETGSVSVQLGAAGFSNVETFIGNNTSSTLTGDNLTSSWIITGQNDGSVGTTNFSDFNNLAGNADTDTFTLNGGTVTGSIGGGGGTDTLVAASGNNSWLITGTDDGNVTGVGSFFSIENLQGNTGADTFVFNNGGAISGIVNGLGGIDSVDQSAQSGAVSISLGASGYTNIESFLGNNINSTLVGNDAQNAWVITGTNSGTVGTVTFSGFTSLTGGSQIDNFTLSGGTLSGALSGGSGSDTLTAGAGQNTWNISGADVGNVTGIASFGGIESLIGNSGADNFVFANGSAFTGSIDGVGGQDTVNFSSELGAVVVAVTASDYVNIETFIGNNSNSTLVADNTANTWTISGNNAGSLNSFTFQGFNNLTGNNSSDDFMISGGSITGTVSGGGGDDSIYGDNAANTWAVTANDAGSVDGINSFTAIDNLMGGALVDTYNISADLSGAVDGSAGDDQFYLSSGITITGGLSGGSGSDTLTGPDTLSDWIINGADSGNVNGITFSQMENIAGGSAVDTFTIGNSAGVSFSGGIDGGGGNDVLDIDFAGTAARSIQFDGNSGTDSIVLRGGGSSFTANFVLGAASGEGTATTTGLGATQTVFITNSEAIEDIQTASTLTLQGSTGNDVLQIGTGSAAGSSPVLVSLGASLPYDAANKTNLLIDGGTGSDTLDITGSASVSGVLTFDNVEQVTDSSGGTLAADALYIDSAITIGSVSAPLATNVDTLAISGGTGSVYVEEQDGLAFSADNISGNLDLETLSGDITSNGAIVVAGSSSFTVGDAGSILLTDVGNSFASTPAFTSSGTIADLTLVTDGDVALAALDLSGDLSIQANGAITQTGAVTVAGTSVFDAADHGITLSHSGNDFGATVSLQNTGNNAVAIRDANNLQFATTSIGAGAFTIDAASVDQVGPITQESNAGDVTITVTSGPVDLNNAANEFTGRLHLYNSGSGAMTVRDASTLLLGTSGSDGGNIALTAASGVDANGTVSTNGGDITITTQTGDIQLGRLDADAGTITLTASNGNILGNHSPFTDPNLSAGDLVITAGAAIGEYTNPIAVMVPSNGTSLFVAGEEPANIIGIAGQILDGSILVNNVSFTSDAVGKGQNAFLLRTIYGESAEDKKRYRLFSISEGGIRFPYAIGKP